MKVKIENPILPGFNPDPNILRVGEMYYIAVSSFEWLPGIRVYQSSDLVAWDYLTDILTDQVDLRGNSKGGSIWAPQISYDNGLYYCIYTNVRNASGAFKDCHNYLTTAPSLQGPWCAPIYLNSSGFDPSLYHDIDGRKWIVNEIWDYRLKTTNKSAGIVLQEYDAETEKLIGERYKIFDGTSLAKTEAPQLYLHNEYYYLLTAEGGTGSGHSVTVCRSKQITGPYELAPNSPILTASDKPQSALQCTGHASIIQATTGHWYMVYLMTRPLDKIYHILGRETAIQEVYWTEDDWLTTCSDGNQPELTPEIVVDQDVKQKTDWDFVEQFNQPKLNPLWNALRMTPNDSWLTIHPREGFVRMISGESPSSSFEHHLLAVRQTTFDFRAQVQLEFVPKTFNQMAGIMLYLNTENYLYFYSTFSEEKGTVLRLIKVDSNNGKVSSHEVAVPKKVELSFKVNGLNCQAQYKTNLDNSAAQPEQWITFLDDIDLRFLSGGFTGNFVGIACHDLDVTGGSYADFSKFSFKRDKD